MNVLAMEQEIQGLLQQANPDVYVEDNHADLFAAGCRVMPRDMLFACMELKKKYPVDYNQVVDQVRTFSLHDFAAAICEQLG